MGSAALETFGILEELAREAHCSAVAANGDLGVDCPTFAAHLACVVERCFCAVVTPIALAAFVRSLHTDDLLLALACSLGSNAGWERFSTLYRKYLGELSHRLAGPGFGAQDLSDAIWVDLFLPDRSGHSRLASYDGRSSLATWLRVIIGNRIINERLRKSSRISNLEGIPEPADSNALHKLESWIPLNRYRAMILDCFRRASLALSARDRLVLLLRYDQELQLGEIARLFSVHQSTITRQMDRALAKLRNDLIARLASEYGLSQDAIQECLSVAFESLSTSVSIVSILRVVMSSDGARPACSSFSSGA